MNMTEMKEAKTKTQDQDQSNKTTPPGTELEA